jgi:hypothetical protein
MENILVRFQPLQTNTGWTISKVTGSKRTGRTIEQMQEFSKTLTMHQAQIVCDVMRKENA